MANVNQVSLETTASTLRTLAAECPAALVNASQIRRLNTGVFVRPGNTCLLTPKHLQTLDLLRGSLCYRNNNNNLTALCSAS